jgi:hypothetical protein
MRIDGPVQVDVVFTGQVDDPNLGPAETFDDETCAGLTVSVQFGLTSIIFFNVMAVLWLDEPPTSVL